MASPFPIDNLPYGVISTADNPAPRCATALDDTAIDLSAIEQDGHFKSVPGFEAEIFSRTTLNAFAALPKSSHSQVRALLTTLLSNAETGTKYAIPLDKVTNHFPMETKNFSDFYCSLEHTQNCSKIMNISTPSNWFIIPSVYNGRTSSLCISGTPIRRPNGVFSNNKNNKPAFQPSTRFDFELEIGLFLSRPLPPGSILDIADAPAYIFGMVLLNDWSARDIQGFEMVPLGPFHGKGAGTTISPWIVTSEALGSCTAASAKVQDPPPLRHLAWRGHKEEETWDVELTARVRRNGRSYLVTETNLKELYWTPYQQLAHLASAGEGLSSGDIFGTGTVTSSRMNTNGENMGIACLLERHLPENKLATLTDNGIGFLEDGDEVIIDGWCVNRHTGRRFGFGECSGVVLPALTVDT